MPASAAFPDQRQQQLSDWLATLAQTRRLDLASLSAASSDAGFRRYFRLASADPAHPSLIAMDAPPPEKCREFVMVQGLLADAGLHVPAIFDTDLDRGFMLLSDLGTTSYLDALTPLAPAAARPLMRDALDALILWQRASRPAVLPPYDAALLRREMDLMPEWFLDRHLGLAEGGSGPAADRSGLRRVFDALEASALAQPQVFVHRDFMPRNLLVGTPNPAVIDFQDAVYGPITYDVVSLLRDAFIGWDEDFQLDCIAGYWERARAAGLPVRADFAEFYRELEWMGLQRHLKILGLFCRLAYRDAKPRYLAELPRFLGYARQVALRYRELAPLARLLIELEGRPATVGYTF